MKYIEILLSRSSNQLAPAPVEFNPFSSSGVLGEQLWRILSRKNGFYAYESALLFRPIKTVHDGLVTGIIEWNDETLWKSYYTVPLKKALCFAEDIFGVQFCVHEDAIQSFNPETGEFTKLADSFDDWANWVLANVNPRTGFPLAHDWQLMYGPLEIGQRLMPIIPFVLGGTYTIDNVSKTLDLEGMRYRANIANQIRDCPDGTIVTLTDKPQP